jgi:hypothetical protein
VIDVIKVSDAVVKKPTPVLLESYLVSPTVELFISNVIGTDDVDCGSIRAETVI